MKHDELDPTSPDHHLIVPRLRTPIGHFVGTEDLDTKTINLIIANSELGRYLSEIPKSESAETRFAIPWPYFQTENPTTRILKHSSCHIPIIFIKPITPRN
jgi:hypothetical protein